MRVLQPGEDRLCRPHSLREGGATPAWLASYFDASRRIATIVAQIVKLVQKLTDDAVLMFIKPCCSPRSTTGKNSVTGSEQELFLVTRGLYQPKTANWRRINEVRGTRWLAWPR